MKKRGISPLIATVLLVGIAVVLATVLMIFLRGVTDDQTTRSEDKLFLGQVCLENVDIEYDSFCFVYEVDPGNPECDQPEQALSDPDDTTDAMITIKVLNRAEVPIKSFSFQIISDERTKIKKSEGDPFLSEYETVEINDLDYEGTIYNLPKRKDAIDLCTIFPKDEIRFTEILIKKQIDYQNIEGYCDDDELLTNIIYEC